MSLWSKFLDLLFPPRCAFCGGLLDGEAGGVCAGCEKALPYVEEGQSLRALDFGPCAAAFYYEGMVRQGVHGLKFQGRRQSAAVFAWGCTLYGVLFHNWRNALATLLASALILAYHPARGIRSKASKWLFYAFYPAHLLVLGLCNIALRAV